MLAEKYVRVKYSVNPRGNVWSNDEDKFGQKMLEKFGWEKGKGLGRQEDGCREHVKVSKKSDTKGLGFKKAFGDNLMNHQDDFNSLLNSLSETHTSVSHADTDVVSKLAEKSGVAKKRVHYHKHVKSKDLSSRTAEDMDCIFGRRKVKMKKPKTDLVPSLSSSSSPSSEVVAPDEAANIDANSESTEKPVIDEKHGVLTINTGQSVSEYFAMKMKMMKESHLQVRDTDSAHKESLVTEPTNLDCSMEVNHCPEQIIKDKSDSTMDVDCCPEEIKKLKKKKKKKKVKDEELEEKAACELITDVDGEHNSESVDNYKKQSVQMTDESTVVQHKKKKKKHKRCKETASDVVGCDGENDIGYGETVCPATGETKAKKLKKKKKEQDCEVVHSKSVLHNSVEQSMVLVNPENQSAVSNSGEQSTVVLNVDTKKVSETRNEDLYTTRRKKRKKRSREEMDNFNQENSTSAEVSDKVSTEECTAPKSRKHKEQLKKECNILHETVNEEQILTVPDETFRSDCSLSNPAKTKDNQQNTSMEPMCRKDIKHNKEALQSASEHFQLLGANVLDIVGYSL